MFRTTLAGVAAAGMLIAGVGAANADDTKTDNRCNHQAVWSLVVPFHGLDTGSAWGALIGGELQGVAGGVSDGVHSYKDNGPKK